MRRGRRSPTDEAEGAAPEPEPLDATDHEAVEPMAEGDPAPSRPRSVSRLRAYLDDQAAVSREELEHQAAQELAASATPALEQLLLNVPGSTSYEDARATLASQAAIELGKPVTVSPDTVIDLRNPPEMGAYPATEKLSNRVLRLANRHWAKEKPRPSADVVAEKLAIAEEEWARRPIGTARCAAVHGALRCRGVFAYGKDDQADGAVVACPACGASHRFDEASSLWVLTDRSAVAMQGSIGSGS